MIGNVAYPTASYSDRDFEPNRTNYYKVRAVDPDGETTLVSHVQAAGLLAPPVVQIGDTTFTSTRYVTLRVRVAAGDSVDVDSLPSFATPTTLTFDESGVASAPWDLGSADATGVWRHVYVRVYTAGLTSPARHDSVRLVFSPNLRIQGDPATVASRTPALVIDGAGVTRMRFASDRTALAAALWSDGAATYGDYVLDAAPDTQRIFGEFQCDFGFSLVDSVIAVPDLLTSVALTINGGVAATSDDVLSVASNARATQMRVALSVADLAATPWEPFASPLALAHGGCAGGLLKTVWAQYRNDWVTADPDSASIQWLPPEVLSVTIAAPDTVTAGDAAVVSGIAVEGTCTDPVDIVQIDVGDGWRVAAGLAAWTYDWTVPAVDDTTTVTLTAQVTAGADMATGQHDVVVLPRP